MKTKIGRNDPCFCGSGEKYKKCCLSLRKMEEIIDFEWRKLRQLEGIVFDQHLSPYAVKELPLEVVKCAMGDFYPEEDLPEAIDKEALFDRLFLPWFLFNWVPEDDFGLENFDSTLRIAQNYMKYHEDRLNSETKAFIDAMNKTYYSFYSVHQVEIDKSVLVKDIFLGTIHKIKEKSGTYQIKRGDIIYSRILTMEEQSIFVGMAPFIIPTSCHSELLDFKEWLIKECNEEEELTAAKLREDFDVDLLSYYFELLDAAYNRPMPTLANTDGDLLQFSKSYFKLTMEMAEALRCLLPLTLSEDADEFLNDAEREKNGEIKEIEFPWLKKGNKMHKSWENTVMGHIAIKPGQLILETNSEKRSETGKKLLMKYLGDKILFQQTLVETPEQKLRSLPESKPKSRKKDEELMAIPEVQEQLQAMAKAHWESWFDEPILALDNQTPRQAAKTEKGRERLEMLLLQYERHDLEKSDNPFKADIPYLKSELSLN